LLRGARPEQRIDILNARHHGDDPKYTRGSKTVTQRDGRAVGRRIHNGKPDVVDIRADRVAEEHHLHDWQRDQDGRSSFVSADVKELFAEQASKRSHCTLPALPAPPASGRARRTNSSSIDSTANSPLS